MNILDVTLLLIFSFFIVSGFSKGLVTQLADLLGFFVALYLAATLGSRFGLFLLEVFDFIPESYFPESSMLAMIIINLLGFMIVYFLTRLAFKMLGQVFNKIASVPVIGTVNAAGGALVGAVKGLLLVIIIIGILSFIPTDFIQDLIQSSFLTAVTFAYIPVMVDFIRETIAVETQLTV